jgi:hypothetical protein
MNQLELPTDVIGVSTTNLGLHNCQQLLNQIDPFVLGEQYIILNCLA